MKQEQKKYLLYLGLVVLGIIIGYLLFNGSISSSQSITSGGTSSGVTTSSPTEEGDRICTKVCVPRPTDCPRQCPIGTHWQCGGTVAMNCGCFPDIPIGGNVITEDTTGARGCLTNPSICTTNEYCDTAMNQCRTVVM